jgi:hypothetical protein
MIPCPSCNRHVRSAESACPFCGTSRSLFLDRTFGVIGGAVTAMVLAACYGSPYKPGDSWDTSAVDADLDGFSVVEDCDDANGDVNPGALEICDDTIDNDCDSATDADDSDCARK